MGYFPKRSEHTRGIKFKSRKLHLLIIANLWLIYFIFLSINYMSNNTYSYFYNEVKIDSTISTSVNFCGDKEYKKSHKDACKENAVLDNGSVLLDQNNEKGNTTNNNDTNASVEENSSTNTSGSDTK